jgi:hypothetical protein
MESKSKRDLNEFYGIKDEELFFERTHYPSSEPTPKAKQSFAKTRTLLPNTRDAFINSPSTATPMMNENPRGKTPATLNGSQRHYPSPAPTARPHSPGVIFNRSVLDQYSSGIQPDVQFVRVKQQENLVIVPVSFKK